MQRTQRPLCGPVAHDEHNLHAWVAFTRAGVVRRTRAGLVAVCATTGQLVPLVYILHRIPRRYRLVSVAGDLLDLRAGAWRFARGSTLPGLRRAHLPPWSPPSLVAAERAACGPDAWERAAPSLDPLSYLVAPRTRPFRQWYPARLQRTPSGALSLAGYDPRTRRPVWLGLVRPTDPDVTAARGDVRAAAIARHAAWWAETIVPFLPAPAWPAWRPRAALDGTP